MYYLLQQTVGVPPERATEYTYAETVQVRDGKALCEHLQTAEFLARFGFQVIAEFEDLEELMNVDPGHAIKLGRDGLGPLKRLNDSDLDALQAELDEGNDEPTREAMDAANAAAAPTQTITPNPNGLTGDDALRLLGIPAPTPAAPAAQQIEEDGDSEADDEDADSGV